jgi:teichuronic acid exporter
LNLKTKVLHGLKWSILAKLFVQILSWASLFYVIRLLSPEAYGLMAILVIIFNVVSMVAVNGFITTLIKLQDKSLKDASQVFSISLLLNILLSALIILSAASIAEFFQQPELRVILQVMALATPLNSFIIIPQAYLSIEMNFKKKAFIEGIGAITGAITAVIFAMNGGGYWSLLFAQIVIILTNIVAYNLWHPCNYKLTYNFLGAGKIIKFVASIQLNSMLWLSYNHIDALIVGKYFGINFLGIYNIAVEIASLPMAKVSRILNQVGFAAFSSLKENKQDSDYYLSRALKLLSLITFPVFFGISGTAYELIHLVLGDKWIESALLVSIFCFIFPFRMMNSVFQNYVNALNRPNINLQNTFALTIVLVMSIIIGIQFGLWQTALAWVIGFAISFLAILYRLKLVFNLPSKLLLIWVRPMLISIAMWLLVYSMNYTLGDSLSILTLFLLKIVSGVIFISLIYFYFYKHEITSILRK